MLCVPLLQRQVDAMKIIICDVGNAVCAIVTASSRCNENYNL